MVNRKQHITLTIFSITFSMILYVLCSCETSKTPAIQDPQRSVYYWRTTFSLSIEETSFISSHSISRLYLRLFDVVIRDGAPKPDATLVFKDQVPETLDVVPVVFITNDVLSSDTTGNALLAQQIVSRVSQMMHSHNISWHELQLDFDWTRRNQTSYFNLLSHIRKHLENNTQNSKSTTHNSTPNTTPNLTSPTLSATVRLHQLSLTPPPVDYGALMVYNIGNFSNPDEQNSILSVSNLKPYLRHLATYPLPLATALPFYSWNLAFQNREFIGIARNLNLSDTTTYHHVSDSKGHGDLYLVKRYHVAVDESISLMDPGLKLFPGYVIRHEECSPALLLEVRQLLAHQRSNALDQIILYHLDNKNFNHFSYEQIETVFGSR